MPTAVSGPHTCGDLWPREKELDCGPLPATPRNPIVGLSEVTLSPPRDAGGAAGRTRACGPDFAGGTCTNRRGRVRWHARRTCRADISSEPAPGLRPRRARA
jgi:hypothetical protein